MEDTSNFHSVNPGAALFTCNTCGVKFTSYELQKFHMKSDWHRYNLKRRVASLPTISGETFAEKVQQLGISFNNRDGNQEEDEYGFVIHSKKKNPDARRQVTKKDLKKLAKSRSVAASQHARAGRQTHRFDSFGNPLLAADRSASPAVSTAASEFSLGDSIHSSEITETESNAASEFGDNLGVPVLEANRSLSLSFESSDDEDVDSDVGSDDDELTDDEEEYDILSSNGCIYCNATHETFQDDLDHMFQKHGLYIPNRKHLKDERGLIQFLWDIIYLDHVCLNCGFEGKNLESIQDHCISKGHCRMPYEYKEEKALFNDYYDQPDTASNNNKESSVETEPELDSTGSELALPSGYRIGHRSMARYYRQAPRIEHQPRDSESTVVVADKRLINMGGLTVQQHQKEFTKMLKQSQKQENFNQRRRLNNLRRANFQPHFIDPNAP